jgi:hypothetical protein
MYVSNHFNHCIKLFAPCGPLIGNKQFLFLFLYCPGADPGFQVSGGANFKKLRRAGICLYTCTQKVAFYVSSAEGL